MAFHETRLPVDIELGAVGGPSFFTTVLELFSGYEQRNINWTKARGRWDIGYGIREEADMDSVRDFFYARRGRAHGFRFKDWTDYELDTQQIGTGDGTETEFQIYKRYSDGGYYYDRDIKKPVSGTVEVYLNGALQASGYSVDTTTGVITFDTAPSIGDVVSAACDFDVPVRFDIDQLPVTAHGLQLQSVTGIDIVELRV